MYHDEIAFDAMTLGSPLTAKVRTGLTDTLEQDFSNHLLGLLLASDLFAARHPGPRHWLESHVLATCWEDAVIRFSGERLDQDDLDALLGCVLLAFRNPGRDIGSTRFSLRELTRLIQPKGRRIPARVLERSLWRLSAARIEIEGLDGHFHIQARLLHTLLCDRAAGLCAIDVNTRIMEGFRSATAVERLLATRAPLGIGSLRRWLAGLLANSPSSLRLEIEALRRLSGLTRQPVAAFRVRAVAALQALLDLGYIASIEPCGPDRLVIRHQIARGEDSACLLLS
jgi:hypothetical protein